jgi:hypothetical protein
VWQTIADVATAVGVVVAIAFGIRSDKLTRDGHQAEKEIAENAASRSEHAAASGCRCASRSLRVEATPCVMVTRGRLTIPQPE